MSCNYAEGLSEYDNKGVLGVKEKFDTFEEVTRKCTLLTEWIQESKHTVFHTGAGISTSVGIPDFRGPKGVWTLEKKGLKPSVDISFNDAIPSRTHMALLELMNRGYVKYIISQNIDGLHMKSGIPRANISEVHGNMFTEQCNVCQKQITRDQCVQTVGKKCQNKPCENTKTSGLQCRGKMYDTILDWEDSLPEDDLLLGEYHSKQADLSICLGTTLQINPSGTLPMLTKKTGGKLVIINLQPTKYDKKANLVINTYVDDVFDQIMLNLNLSIPDYDQDLDPTKQETPIDWTTPDADKFLKKHKPKEFIKPPKKEPVKKRKATRQPPAKRKASEKANDRQTKTPRKIDNVKRRAIEVICLDSDTSDEQESDRESRDSDLEIVGDFFEMVESKVSRDFFNNEVIVID